jgi:hypothetical protein
LTPVKEGDNFDFDPEVPFQGDTYVESQTDIMYGVAPAIPAELIVEFIQSNEEKLIEKGYNLKPFLEQRLKAK